MTMLRHVIPVSHTLNVRFRSPKETLILFLATLVSVPAFRSRFVHPGLLLGVELLRYAQRRHISTSLS
jgi:hypothetical protein